MPVRAVCKPHSPDLKKRRSSGCNLWRSLLERPPPRWNPGFETRSEQERVVLVWTWEGVLHIDIYFKDGVSKFLAQVHMRPKALPICLKAQRFVVILSAHK